MSLLSYVLNSKVSTMYAGQINVVLAEKEVYNSSFERLNTT